MEVVKVSYSKGLTLSIGRFEFLRFDISMEGRILEGESYNDCYAELKRLVEARIAEELQEHKAYINGQEKRGENNEKIKDS